MHRYHHKHHKHHKPSKKKILNSLKVMKHYMKTKNHRVFSRYLKDLSNYHPNTKEEKHLVRNGKLIV